MELDAIIESLFRVQRHSAIAVFVRHQVIPFGRGHLVTAHGLPRAELGQQDVAEVRRHVGKSSPGSVHGRGENRESRGGVYSIGIVISLIYSIAIIVEITMTLLLWL